MPNTDSHEFETLSGAQQQALVVAAAALGVSVGFLLLKTTRIGGLLGQLSWGLAGVAVIISSISWAADELTS